MVEGGFKGGGVTDGTSSMTPEQVEKIRSNVEKAKIVGSLVANDYSSAMIQLERLELDPATGKQFDSIEVYKELEALRQKYQSKDISLQIIGFDMAIGEIAAGTRNVLAFLLLAVILIAFLSKWFLRNWHLTLFAISCSLIGVIWNLGIVSLLGYGLDVFSILLPFLIFAIGMSHAIQILNRVNIEWEEGLNPTDAAVATLKIMMAPALCALATELAGAISIIFIPIPSIQELRIFTCIGVVALMFTNVFLLAVLASYIKPTDAHVDDVRNHRAWRRQFWVKLSNFTTKKYAICMCSITALLLAVFGYFALGVQTGDLHEGVPELKRDSQYNQDSRFIAKKYLIGSDVFTTFVTGKPYAFLDYNVIKYADDLAWVIQNNPHVSNVLSLSKAMKLVASTYGEGHPKWMGLSPNVEELKAAARPITPAKGLSNGDYSVLPIYAFLKDHKASTMISVIDTINTYVKEHKPEGFAIELAGGNTGVMAAVNETIDAAQYPLLISLFVSVTLLCLLLFRSWRATICILVPLICVSVYAYGLLDLLEIGLKTSTLPVVALGTGLGIDYGIYIFSVFLPALRSGTPLREAYLYTLESTGSAVCFIGLALSISVGIWIFSDLKFQVDMGLLFSSMLLLNMLGVLFVLPGIAYFLFPEHREG